MSTTTPRVWCSNAFDKKPSKLQVKDYYDVVEESSVVTWKTLRARKYASKAAFLADIERLRFNAAVYNRGVEVPNPDYVPGGGALLARFSELMLQLRQAGIESECQLHCIAAHIHTSMLHQRA